MCEKEKSKVKDSENKHSRLPLMMDIKEDDSIWIFDANGKLVFEVINFDYPDGIAPLLTAINSHDNLVEALENTTQRLYLLKKHIDILQKSTGSKHGSCHVIEGIEILTKNNEQALKTAEGE